MPFAPSSYPALGLSLLKSVLAQASFPVRLHYATLTCVRALGRELYDSIAHASPRHLVGDWIFGGALAPRAGPSVEAYISEVLTPAYGPEFVRGVIGARAQAADFVASIVGEVLGGDPRVVGFTSTFAQHAASLAAARAIKELRPDVSIVFGGANCEGVMAAELVRRFPFVDAVVSGEGEAVVVEVAERLAAGSDIDLRGVYTRGRTWPAPYLNTPVLADLDTLPLPDFDDFFAAVDAVDPTREEIAPHLLVETSRGCWWGAKHHCTFCGLNGSTMAFRSKSPDRVHSELRYLTERYGVKTVSAVDNILDYKYFQSALPLLAESGLDVSLFFEVKANMRRDQVALLRAAGVRAVQPGIESLDSGVLRLMRKGVTALQNVQLLKLCKEYGITVAWNILAGFPNEDPAAYARMAKLAPLLTHLPPPDHVTLVRLDRFSPLFAESDEFGLLNVRPARAYADVYGEPVDALRSLAYYFDFEYADGRDVHGYTRDLAHAVRDWLDMYDGSDLATIDGHDALLLIDTRPIAKRATVLLAGLDRLIYLACDTIQNATSLVDAVAASGMAADAGDVIAACARFVADGLMIEDAGRYLALGVPLESRSAGRRLRERFAFAASALEISGF